MNDESRGTNNGTLFQRDTLISRCVCVYEYELTKEKMSIRDTCPFQSASASTTDCLITTTLISAV